MGRPAKLCKLKTGQIIDVHRHFVETFNWLVDFVNGLNATGKIKLDRTDESRPTISMEDPEAVESAVKGVLDNQYVVTDVSWNAANQTLDISKGKLALDSDGKLYIDSAQGEAISTVSHSSLHSEE